MIDAAGLEDIFHLHYEGLCRYAFTFLKDQESAEDVAQKIFVKIWERKEDIAIWKDTKAYLYRSVHNTCLNELKRKSHTSASPLMDVHHQQEAEASLVMEASELEQRIENAVNLLPEKCQEVFRLSRFEELSYKEISERMNISVKTVENHMGKALKTMRTELADYLPTCLIFILFTC